MTDSMPAPTSATSERVYHPDPRDRLLMLYGMWVKCLPHQPGRRVSIEKCIERCKAACAARRGGQ